MINREEALKIIEAINRKKVGKEKLSFLTTNESINIYRKNKLFRVTIHEMLKIINLNAHLLKSDRNQFDILGEYVINKFHKKEKPYPEIVELNIHEWEKFKMV